MRICRKIMLPYISFPSNFDNINFVLGYEKCQLPDICEGSKDHAKKSLKMPEV